MKSFEERFIIDCYGIIDTDRELTGHCKDDKLSWLEIKETLNRLYKSANLDNEKLMRENDELKKEIHSLKEVLRDIHDLSK